MNTKRASTTTVDPATYNGQQFDAPALMTKAWARVTLLVTIGLLALGAGIAGALYVSPLALGAGAIVGLPFLVFGGIMGLYTWSTHKQIYPSAPKSPAVTPRAAQPEEVGHVVNIAGRDMVLPNLEAPALDKPVPLLVGFPVCANDVLFVLSEATRRGLGFRAWVGKRLPSGTKLDRAGWIAVQDGLLKWRFATSRQTATGRVVELRADVEVEAMLDAVRKGSQ